MNHLLGDPAGKAVGKLINKGNKNRRPHGRPQPSNVEHHHHHYLPEPEYPTEEGKQKIRISNRAHQVGRIYTINNINLTMYNFHIYSQIILVGMVRLAKWGLFKILRNRKYEPKKS